MQLIVLTRASYSLLSDIKKYIFLSIKSSLSVIIPQGTIDSESAGTDLIISFYCKMMMFIDITIRQTLK